MGVSRIRNIKPAFFEDEAIARLLPLTRLFYIGLWTRCDYQGVFEWQPKVLAGLFPYDETVSGQTVSDWLETLTKLRRIRSYLVDGKRFGCVLAFVKHQAISGREKQRGPQYPAFTPKLSKCQTSAKQVPGPADLGQRTKDVGLGTSDLGRGTPDKGPRTQDVGQRTCAQSSSPIARGPLRGPQHGDPKKEKTLEEAEAASAAIVLAREIEQQRIETMTTQEREALTLQTILGKEPT